jgi:hypothetical protein
MWGKIRQAGGFTARKLLFVHGVRFAALLGIGGGSIELIERPLKLAERGPTRKRVLERVVDFVETFIKGIAA